MGTANLDRMVITHSPAYTNWGLRYRDTDDSFHFVAGGTTVLRVGLLDRPRSRYRQVRRRGAC